MSQPVWERWLDVFGLRLDHDYGRMSMRSEPVSEERQDVIQLHPNRQPAAATVPLVRAEPHDMTEATVVADEIKRQIPVILNLEGTSPDEARRIRDFLAGVTYGLNGYMKRLGSWVYACSPFDMPIERLILDGTRIGEARYEDEEYAEFEDEDDSY